MIQEASTTHTQSPFHDAYTSLIASKDIKSDPAQLDVINIMGQHYPHLINYTPKHAAPFFTRWKYHTTPPKGLYIHGDVGRGKSMLMDLFFHHLPIEKKRRVHFHAFMLGIHEWLHNWRKSGHNNKNATDPLPHLAKDIAKNTWVLCFDELFVTDIADAMILGRLFSSLFHLGVVVIATSNRPPDDLYKDGLQRKRFLPFIKLLHHHTQIIHLQAEKDYRMDRLQSMQTLYFTPLGKKATKFIQTSFAKLTNHATPQPTTLHIQGHNLVIPYSAGDIAMVSFTELCEQPLGAADYLELATDFTTLLLTDIPQMNPEMRNEAKRFVTLIDTLYEHNVKLICSAAVPTEQLYLSGTGAFEFERTISRLHEMQSHDYWKTEHH